MRLKATGTRRARRLRIMVLGLRGIIDVQGGIETHARRLYPLLARLGCDVEIVQRSAYYPRDRRRQEWRRLALTYLWSPRTRIVETAVHTLLGVFYAAFKRPDVLHIHAVGPGLSRIWAVPAGWFSAEADWLRRRAVSLPSLPCATV